MKVHRTTTFPDAILKGHTAVLGMSGSGKTSTEKLLIEQVAADGARVCILDPIKSDHWGLTSMADGKHAGLPFSILGGDRGHVPLHAGAGHAIGELVATGALPLSILDMSDFPPGGLQQFFCDFAQVLLRKMKGVVYLFIEEAHEFAPKERAGVGNENMALHWAKKLATAGRTKGLRIVVATQRTQSLHNALLGSCGTVIAHRLMAPADQEPVLKWLKGNVKDAAIRREVDGSLSELQDGEGWVCAGAAKIFERRQFPRIQTYDNTKTPDSDDEGHDGVRTAPVDLAGLRTIVGKAVADAEANDPRVLKARVAQLEAQVKAGATPDGRVELMQERQEAYQQGQKVGRDEGWAQGHLEGFGAGLDRAMDAFKALVHGMPMPAYPGAPNTAQTRPPAPQPKSLTTPTPKAPVTPTAPSRPGSGQNLPPGERAILTAAAQFNPVGRNELTVLTGYKKSSRDAYIARLIQKGMVEAHAGAIAPTPAGMAALGDGFERLPTGAALRDYWLGRLPSGEGVILKTLAEAYPAWIARGDLDQQTGFKKSSRDAYISRMKAKRLIEDSGRGQVRASASLF